MTTWISSDGVTAELVPIRGRTFGLHAWGRVHWGIIWPWSDRDARLDSLCSTAHNRYPVFGLRVHPRIAVECKHCLAIAAKAVSEPGGPMVG